MGQPPAPISAEERDLAMRRAQALTRCSVITGFDKGFPRRVVARAPESIGAPGAAQLARLAWKYRRQMPAALVPASKPG